MAERNWSGTVHYRATTVHRPTSVGEVKDLVGRSSRLRVLGTRHTFTDITDADTLLSVADIPGSPMLDERRRTVTFPAGMRYGELARFLEDRGWALANLASLPHICVAGSVATATHGSGNRNAGLASAVRSVTLVTGTGDLVTIDETSPELAGAAVHLGALGVMVELSLAVEPTFQVRQDVYEYLPWESLIGSFDELMGAGYSVSVMTDFAADTADSLWVKTRLESGDVGAMPAELFGASAATQELHPTRGYDPSHCTRQLGVPGPWCDRLPHFVLEHTPSTGEEIHSEYLFDRRHAADAITALRGLGSVIAPRAKSCEIRTVAADELWLSMAYGRDCAAIHFTWRPDTRAVLDAVEDIERVLAPFEPRPHWGKVFGRPPRDWADLYPRLADFRALADSYDPQGVLRNPFLDRTIFAD